MDNNSTDPNLNNSDEFESKYALIPASQLSINPDPICDYEDFKCQFDPQVPFYEKTDYIVAACSGVLTAALDILLVGKITLKDANTWGTEHVNDFVLKAARKVGYKGDDLKKAVEFLEKKFPLAGDAAMNSFGGGLQHHLRDFSHHPTVIGLAFSLLTQFTGMCYGTDVTGCFIVVPVPEGRYIGKTTAEKLLFGTVYWMFHMISDMAGSSGSIGRRTSGTGIPGPMLSFMKEVSSMPFFNSVKDEKGVNEFSKWLSGLFNGTKTPDGVKFDLRTELGLLYNQMIHSLPVIVNEIIVRGYYMVSRFCVELQDKNIKSIKQLRKIDIRRIIPIKQRKLTRMLTISSGTFFTITTAVTVIRGVATENYADIFINLNYVGIARFVIAVKDDFKYIVEDVKAFKQELLERQARREKWYAEQNIGMSYFTLTGEQVRILESLKNQKIKYDINKSRGSGKTIKQEWLADWCLKSVDSYGENYLIDDEPVLYNTLRNEVKTNDDKSWLYLVAIELTRFKPFYPWGEDVNKDKRYKKVHTDFDYENDVFVVLQSYIDRTEYQTILRNIRKYDEKLENSQKSTADTVLLVAGVGLAVASAALAGPLVSSSYGLMSNLAMTNTRLATMNLLTFGGGRISKGSIKHECSGILTYCKMMLSHREDRVEVLNRIIDYMESSRDEYEEDIALMKASTAKDKDKSLINISESNLKFIEQTINEIKKMK
ncbi:MAG: hypothetical protein IKE94_17915 [Aeriscardovia sp.]|nr:hypothetical protein [Aeriscardovia sp.]